MSDERFGAWDDGGLHLDVPLERALRDLGPLIQRLDAIQREEPSHVFRQALRARLSIEQKTPPEPISIRARPHRKTTHNRTVRHPMWRREPRLWVGLAVALAVLVVAIAPRIYDVHQYTPPLSSGLPRPRLSDLTRDYPYPPGQSGGAGGLVTPEQSAFDPDQPPLYYGPLHVSASQLPRADAPLPAYRLARPLAPAQLARLARQLHITQPVARVHRGSVTWVVAANSLSGLGPSPLHSVAVASPSGEVIYHHVAMGQAAHGHQVVYTQTQAIAAAHAWVAMLGWPGRDMPTQASTRLADGSWLIDLQPIRKVGGTVPGAHAMDGRPPRTPHCVRWGPSCPRGRAPGTMPPYFSDRLLGWASVAAASTPAATVRIAPGGGVMDACLWPPLARSYLVSTRSARNAFDALRRGKLPFAIMETNSRMPFAPTNGRGVVNQVDVEQVLTRDAEGQGYLVPVYRFSGVAYLSNGSAISSRVPNATWYALVPAMRPQ